MKSLMLLALSTLKDLGVRCCTSTTHDEQYVMSRFEHEGLAFLGITLANFGADFQKSLDQGYVDDALFQGFRRGKGGLPLFLGGFLHHVFDSGTGRLLEDADLNCIFAVRQFTLMWAKIKSDVSPRRKRKSVLTYLECENRVKSFDRERTPEMESRFSRMSQLLWADLFQLIEEDVYYGRLHPRHGPGSTADKLLGNKKWTQHIWPDRLDRYFPMEDYLIPNYRHHSMLERVDSVEPGNEQPVEVIHVPKTLKTPRIIAMEPTCMMYAQQALQDKFYEYLESDSIRFPGFIGFTDQVPNQDLAREGSLYGDLATLDLREASDSVSNQLVRLLFKYTPHLNGAVDACRSRKADVMGEQIIRLSKFASMGSALCFPMEAIVFTTIVFLGIEKELNRQLTHEDIKSFKGQVRVYGDDIIIPVEFVQSVISELETFGLLVNRDKSFWTGKFRESCGGDFYAGEDVTVVRLRSELPSSLTDVDEIVKAVAFRNQCYVAGMWGVSRHMDSLLSRILRYFPSVDSTSPVLGSFSYLGYETQKLSETTHSPMVKGYVVKADIPDNGIDGLDALNKIMSKRSDLPFADDMHLQRSGRPRSVYIVPRWTSPF